MVGGVLDLVHIDVPEKETYVPFSGRTAHEVKKRSKTVSFKTIDGRHFPTKSSVRVIDNNEQGDWPPLKTWCWWCCHPFDGTPLTLPIEYDDKRDLFTVTGIFCCWGCVKAYNIATMGYRSGRVSDNIAILHRRVEGFVRPLKSSPPRQMLDVFGGPLGIEAFRAVPNNTSYKILPKNVLYQVPNIACHETTVASKKAAADAPVDFEGAQKTAPKAEPLRLRRSKPTTNHRNTLDAMPGINFFKKMSK
jgi:hypothetical protein